MDNHDFLIDRIDLNNAIDIERATELRRLTFVESYGDDEKFFPDTDDKKVAYTDFLKHGRKNNPNFGEKLVKNDKIIAITEYKIIQENNTDIGYINGISVDEHHRRMGYGQYLHDRAISWFKSQGANKAWLRTTVMNDKALAFYFKNEWAIIGSDIHYSDSKIKLLQRTIHP